MIKRRFVIAGMLLTLMIFLAVMGTSERAAASQDSSEGLAAVDKAAKAGKYLFVFVYKDGDQQVREMRAAFDKATNRVRNKARTVAVDVADPAEKAFVDQFKLEGAPTPMVLVLAPNGAITAGIRTQLDDKQVADAFASDCAEKCLKVLQGGKFVLLCVQNDASKSGVAAMRAALDIKTDPRYAFVTEVVTVDPREKEELSFLSTLQVDTGTGEAITLILAPPGAILRKFTGPISKDDIAAVFSSINSGTCGPSNKSTCCPKK